MPKARRRAAGPQYIEQIINSLTSGVVALDADGVVVIANAAAAAHLHVEASRLAPGCRFDALPHVRPFLDIIQEVRDFGRAVQRREIILDFPDGERKEIGLTASPLEGPEAFNGVIFLFVDMTERRRLERAAELNQQLATIGELTAGVVHELRNPVSVIRGMAELLLRKLVDEDLQATARLIFDEAIHLERSIAQFLGFARPFELELAWCNADEVAERALQLCRRRAEDKGVELVYRPEGELPDLRVDPGRLAQALANLLTNAVDAVDAGGYAGLIARQDGNEMVYEVVDNGPGLHLGPGEDPFQPFFTGKEDGTGLGLAIVHRIVTAHHGSVSCGDRPTGGAKFEVRIPLDSGAHW